MLSPRFEASLAEVSLSVAYETTATRTGPVGHDGFPGTAGTAGSNGGGGGEESPTRPKTRARAGADAPQGLSRPLLRLRTLFVFTSSDPHPFMEPVFSPTFATSVLSPYTRCACLAPRSAPPALCLVLCLAGGPSRLLHPAA